MSCPPGSLSQLCIVSMFESCWWTIQASMGLPLISNRKRIHQDGFTFLLVCLLYSIFRVLCGTSLPHWFHGYKHIALDKACPKAAANDQGSAYPGTDIPWHTHISLLLLRICQQYCCLLSQYKLQPFTDPEKPWLNASWPRISMNIPTIRYLLLRSYFWNVDVKTCLNN